jgi:hypothetical protein
VGAALAAPAAQAAPCDGVGMQQPFLDWNDRAQYVLVDGGDFEASTAGWTLEDGAATVAGGNPFRPDSSATSLSLPAGSSVTTPPICVSKGNPTARIFAQTPSPSTKKKASLKVHVLYLRADGSVRKVKKAGKLRQNGDWNPTKKFSLAQGQFNQGAKPEEAGTQKPENPGANKPENPGGQKPDKPGGDKPDKPGGDKPKTAQIQLRFTPVAGSGWLIDDVFVDPRMRR